jgi:hypothetical protein
MKAKIYKVSIGAAKFLVYGTSRASAVNNLFEAMKKDTVSQLATGEEIYTMAQSGANVEAGYKYKPEPVDVNQVPLDLDDPNNPSPCPPEDDEVPMAA